MVALNRRQAVGEVKQALEGQDFQRNGCDDFLHVEEGVDGECVPTRAVSTIAKSY